MAGRSDALGAEVVSLAYNDTAFTMLLLLPDEGANLTETAARMADANFGELHAACRSEEVELSVPRFTVATDTMLAEVLARLGATSMFSEQEADLSGISARPTAVSDVLHQVKGQNTEIMERKFTGQDHSERGGHRGRCGHGDSSRHKNLHPDTAEGD